MKKLTLTVAVTAVVGLLALASPALAETPVTSFAPASTPGVWFEFSIDGCGCTNQSPRCWDCHGVD